MNPPIPTANSLKDIIDWLREGDKVIIHSSNYGKTYHNCVKFKNVTNRVIYIDVSSMPSLIDEGEWPWYIENDGHTLCDCLLDHCDNTYYFKLPY